MITVLNIKRF